MLAAASVALEVGIVAAGVVVVLLALLVAGRPRGSGSSGPPAPAVARPGPERRTMARAPVARPVTVVRGAGATQQRTFALDVGVGGLLLAGPADLTVGELLDVVFDLGAPIGARARVVRETPDGMKGVAFEAIAAADLHRLERFVRDGAPA